MVEVHRVFIDVCDDISRLSKCQFTKVACIFVNDSGRIISSGVNGTISGSTNCCDLHFEERDDHRIFSDEHETHAEMNAILDLARSGANPRRISVYTSLSPCYNCLKHILALTKRHGDDKLVIDRIVYGERYHRLSEEDLNRMKERCSDAGTQLQSIQEAVEDNEFQSKAT